MAPRKRPDNTNDVEQPIHISVDQNGKIGVPRKYSHEDPPNKAWIDPGLKHQAEHAE